MSNTWPGGYPHAMGQDEHEAWNSWNFPGTRQECTVCGGYTGRCDEDSIYIERDGLEAGPLCESCYDEMIDTAPGAGQEGEQ